jgi:antitoxin component YwqK of YwqJK toxin-antitoxin module
MKNISLFLAICFVSLLSAQNKENHEIVDQMVKSTYFHDNGEMKASGFYKDGKLHGTWTSFDEAGKKIAMGQYDNGKKVGKWFFWTEGLLNEVDFNDYRVAQVKTWQSTAIAKN